MTHRAWLVVYRALSDATGKGAFFLITIAAAHRLPVEAFGLFALGTTLGWMAAVAADAGIQLHVARVVATRPGAAGPTIRQWLRVRLWTTGVVFVVVAAGLLIAARPLVSSLAVLLFVAAYLLAGLVELFYYLFRGLARSDIESTITIGHRGGMLVLAFAALWWSPSTTLLAGAMLTAAAAALWYTRRAAAHLLGPHLPPATAGAAVRADLSRIAPIGAGIVLSALYFRIDAVLIDVWLGAGPLGLYNAAFRPVDALRLLPAAVLAVALPGLFRATSRTPFMAIAGSMAVGAAALSAALAAAAGWLLPALFGSRFVDAVPAFRILLLAFPLMALNGVLTHQLIGWDGHRTYALACATALLVNLALNARLIPLAGIEGAAWTTVWTEAVITVTCGIALARLDPVASLSCATSRASAS